jgi:chemotaxis response regulator CheB
LQQFHGNRLPARQAVTESATLLDGVAASEDATVEGAIETSRQAIASLLAGMERVGMPKEAIAMGGAAEVLPLERISAGILRAVAA